MLRPLARAFARRTFAVVLGLLACGLLGYNTAASSMVLDFAELRSYRRLWTDQALAITAHLERTQPMPPAEAAMLPTGASWTYREILIELVHRRGIEPHQFWRTIPDRRFRRDRRRMEPPPFDDPGRALLLDQGFRLLRGISPMLIVWLGAFCAGPLFLWIVWEGCEAGRAVSATAFTLLLAASPFVVESLALTRHPVGFYLVGLLTLGPLAYYGLLRPDATLRGLLLRAALASVFFAVAAACRSGTLFLLPGFMGLLGASATRITRCHSRQPTVARAWYLARILGTTTAGMALLVGPYAATRVQGRHAVWVSLWEGLGDFDRTKGHTWTDEAALEAALRNGGRAPRPGESLVAALSDPENEAVMRRLVSDHITGDPAWFLEILARRLAATVTLQRLWPWHPRDGLWMALSSSPNEGYMDKYYGYTTTADWLSLGQRAWELPVSLIVAPTLALLALPALRRLRSRGERATGAVSAYLLLASFASAALPLPVLMTTAGGQETQAFVFVYYLGAALLLGEIVDALAHATHPPALSGPRPQA